jgi:hypothetical protein
MKTSEMKITLPLLSPRTVNIVTHNYGTFAVLPQILLPEDGRNSGRRFEVCTICNKKQQNAHRDQIFRVND